MTERDRATVRIDPAWIQLEIPNAGDHLRGEGLIQLDRIEVALRWLSSAHWSCSSRVIPYRRATTSAVCPRLIGGYFPARRGFTIRQPIVLSCSVCAPRPNSCCDFSRM